jgi:hypothetical protein
MSSDDEDRAIIHWLLGNEKRPQPNYPSPGCAALIRRLRAGEPLGERVSNALARALEPIGVSRMKFTLKFEKRGRGRPRHDVDRAYETLKLGSRIDAEIAAREAEGFTKRYLDTKQVALAAGKSRASGYAARKTTRRAKGLEK